MPVRNGAMFIQNTLNSLKDSKVSEIIISDNFSTDNTREIIAKFDNIRVITPRTPLTMSENWNFVTKSVQTEYFRLVSHDDLPNIDSIIDHQMILDAHPEVGMVYSRRGFVIEYKLKTKFQKSKKFGGINYESSLDLLKAICRSGTNPCSEPFAVTIRTSLFQRDEGAIEWATGEACELNTYLQLSRMKQIYESEISGGHFRLHTNSHSGKIQRYFRQARMIIDWVKNQPEYCHISYRDKLLLHLLVRWRATLRMVTFTILKLF